MRYFKLINGEGWVDYHKGVIYKGNEKHSGDVYGVEFFATKAYSDDWIEVSEEEYLKQEG